MSNLPRDLREYLLSFLTVREVIRTTPVNRDWLWMLVGDWSSWYRFISSESKISMSLGEFRKLGCTPIKAYQQLGVLGYIQTLGTCVTMFRRSSSQPYLVYRGGDKIYEILGRSYSFAVTPETFRQVYAAIRKSFLRDDGTPSRGRGYSDRAIHHLLHETGRLGTIPMIMHLFAVLVEGFRSLDVHGGYSEDEEDVEEDISFIRRKLATITKVDTPEVGASREFIEGNFSMLFNTHGKTCLDGLLTGILHRKDGGGSILIALRGTLTEGGHRAAMDRKIHFISLER